MATNKKESYGFPLAFVELEDHYPSILQLCSKDGRLDLTLLSKYEQIWVEERTKKFLEDEEKSMKEKGMEIKTGLVKELFDAIVTTNFEQSVLAARKLFIMREINRLESK
jgi:hypothetical protein